MKSAYILLSILTISIASCKSKQPCVANPRPDCMCTMQYDPVCGCDGKTYGNSCQAGCAGVTVVSKGECPEKK